MTGAKADSGNPQLYVRSDDVLLEPQVKQDELGYIDQRRKAVVEPNQGPSQKKSPWFSEAKKPPGDLPPEESLTGLTLSGGGMRSATFNLGVLQGLANCGVLRLVDYLSTVSGGGYIGACLSSLMLTENQGALVFGTDNERFPFNAGAGNSQGIKVFDLDQAGNPLPSTEEGENQQLKHLRAKGNFVTPRVGFFTRDTMRTGGLFFTGLVYTLFTFLLVMFVLAAFHYWLVNWIVPGIGGANIAIATPIPTPKYTTVVVLTPTAEPAPGGVTPAPTPEPEFRPTPTAISLGQAPNIAIFEIPDDVLTIEPDVRPQKGFPPVYVWSFIPGFVLAVIIFGRLYYFFKKSDQQNKSRADIFSERLTQFGTNKKTHKWLRRLVMPQDRSTEEILDLFILRLILILYLAIFVIFVALLATVFSDVPRKIYWLWVPLAFMLGGWLGTVAAFRFSFGNYRGWTLPFRSVIGAYQAFCFFGVIASFLFAALAIPHYFQRPNLGLSVSGIVAVLSFLWASNVANKLKDLDKPKVEDIGKKFIELRPWMQKSLLAILVGLLLISVFVFFELLFEIYAYTWSARLFGLFATGAGGSVMWMVFGLMVGGFVLLFFLLRFVNWNKISPHYLYRDRLTDAFLRTEMTDKAHYVKTARDDSDRRVKQLNPPGSTAPYHLIVATLNLQGSRDLAHKDQRADHFIFSRFYCGSRTTGYVKTEVYRDGLIKLARAMTISGAAASTAMGRITFFAQAFMMTILNARLGYWLVNPRKYQPILEQKQTLEARLATLDSHDPSRNSIIRELEALQSQEDRLNNAESRTGWLAFLWDQLRGQPSARRNLVDLSDGAHTGDNNGLYPLLQRRCKIIVVGDAGCDPKFRFEDLSRVIRWAYLNDYIDIHINPEPLRPDEKTGFSATHFVVGKIDYPEIKKNGTVVLSKETGYLLYLKPAMTDNGQEVSLRRYWRQHCQGDDQFPHQTTADQYYDEDQFEAYRRLGEISVRQAFEKLAGESNTSTQPPSFEKVQKSLADAYAASTATKEAGEDANGRKGCNAVINLFTGWFSTAPSGR